jgi:hypothetical protein
MTTNGCSVFSEKATNCERQKKYWKMGNVSMTCCSTISNDSDADEGASEPKLDWSEARQIRKIDSFASTASSKTTLQPSSGRNVTLANASSMQHVIYPVMLTPHAVKNSCSLH